MTRQAGAAAMAVLLALLVHAAGVAAQASRQVAVTGMVMRVDAARNQFVVSHDAVVDVMPAMTMPFDVRNAKELDGVSPGMTVAFTLALGADEAYARDVRIVRYTTSEQDPLTARRLSLLRRMTGKAPPSLAVGAAVPDFTLVDQARRPVSLSQFRGKVVALNFIYTSCALPQFCYRMTNHFGVVQKRFASLMGHDLVLVTVTFDPGRDTPERLAAYAAQWNANADTWRFLTGEAPAIARVCGFFGVDFFPDEGLMNHSLHTVVVDRAGTMVANVEGNRFTAAQLGDLVETVLRR